MRVLRCENLSFSYPRRPALFGVSLAVRDGETTALLGMNGSGKTTLLKIMSGLMSPGAGNVFVQDRNLRTMTRLDRSRMIAYLPQKSEAVGCTSFEAVLLGRKPHMGWEASRRDLEIVEGTLNLLGLAPLALRLTTELSGGEYQKVLIARALAQEPAVLLLDEPVSHLDIKSQIEIMQLVRSATQRLGIVTVMVLHDISLALRFCDRFLMLKEGRLCVSGGSSVMEPSVIRDVFGIDVVVGSLADLPVVVPLGR